MLRKFPPTTYGVPLCEYIVYCVYRLPSGNRACPRTPIVEFIKKNQLLNTGRHPTVTTPWKFSYTNVIELSVLFKIICIFADTNGSSVNGRMSAGKFTGIPNGVVFQPFGVMFTK